MSAIKRALLGALAAPGARTMLRPFRQGVGTIFMLHRFNDPDTGTAGHDPAELRQTLGLLRRRGYELVELGEIFRRLAEPGHAGDLGVAFTLDDGYADQVRVAGPIFSEFDCPATVFVTTGFLDQELWFWWDRIEYVFDRCRTREVPATIGGERLTYRWPSEPERAQARNDFTVRCKGVSDAEKHEAIGRLAEAAGVELPSRAPARYAPMTWSELRSWEQRGMTFGPHTVTHPILSKATDEQSRRELAGSWERLQVMATRPAPIFCYPNGQPGDYGAREYATLRDLGLRGAVVGTPGYASTARFHGRTEAPYQVRRFNYPEDSLVVAQYVSGAERLREWAGGQA